MQTASSKRRSAKKPAAGLKKAKPSAKHSRAPSARDLGLDLAGSTQGLPADIATNRKYMAGFGK